MRHDAETDAQRRRRGFWISWRWFLFFIFDRIIKLEMIMQIDVSADHAVKLKRVNGGNCWQLKRMMKLELAPAWWWMGSLQFPVACRPPSRWLAATAAPGTTTLQLHLVTFGLPTTTGRSESACSRCFDYWQTCRYDEWRKEGQFYWLLHRSLPLSFG